jgi:hypothetical protein
MSQNRIALKPYLERIQEFCLPLSKEDLTEVLAGLGKDVSTYFEEITKGLKSRKGIQSLAAECLPWAEKIGKSRIEGIVSNKHREAYDRAARYWALWPKPTSPWEMRKRRYRYCAITIRKNTTGSALFEER